MGNKSAHHEDHQASETKDAHEEDDPEVSRIQCLSFDDFSKEVGEFINQLNLKSSECVKLYNDVTEVHSWSSPVYQNLEQNFDDIQNNSANLRKRLYYRRECGRENEADVLNGFVIDLVRIANVITRDESAFLLTLKRKAKELGGEKVSAEDFSTNYIPLDDTNPQAALNELRSTEADKKKLDDDILETLVLYLDVKSLVEGAEEDPIGDRIAMVEENIRAAETIMRAACANARDSK